MKLGLTLALIAVVTNAVGPPPPPGWGPPQLQARAYRHENCENEDRFEDCREAAAIGRANEHRYNWCINRAFDDEMDDCDGLGLCEMEVEDRLIQVEGDWDCLDDGDSCGCP